MCCPREGDREQRRGVRVTVVSTISTQVADELQRKAGIFTTSARCASRAYVLMILSAALCRSHSIGRPRRPRIVGSSAGRPRNKILTGIAQGDDH